MTRDVTGPADSRLGHNHLEADVLAILWEEVPFPRLPFDAPRELKERLVEVENPKRVHTIHCASRRYHVQLLIEKFVVQLRYGCGYSDCTTPSCFSCRKRNGGKAPVRRYSPASARTLAVFLANQDNPESHLCPHLQPPRGPNDAIKTLKFESRPGPEAKGPGGYSRPKQRQRQSRSPSQSSGRSISPGERQDSSAIRKDSHLISDTRPSVNRTEPVPEPSSPLAPVSVSERPVNKDYRSFAANVFGTVAFKMLEWLTPNNFDAIEGKAVMATSTGLNDSRERHNRKDDDEESLFVRSRSPSRDSRQDTQAANTAGNLDRGHRGLPSGCEHEVTPSDVEVKSHPLPSVSRGHHHETHRMSGLPKTNSKARVRTPSLPKPQPKVSAEHFSEISRDEITNEHLSPRTVMPQAEKVPKSFIRSPTTISRQVSADNLLDVIVDEEPSSQGHSPDASERQPIVDGVNGEESSSVGDTIPSADPSDDTGGHPLANEEPDSTSGLDELLPQSLSSLNIQTVNFLCDVLQEDGTTETHLLEPQAVTGPAKRRQTKVKNLKRKRKPRSSYPRNLKLEWKLFVEQSIFLVLSDPFSILESFTTRDVVWDSQSLWYCMLRMTRAAPHLVFDSLWTASASLFAPPKILQSLRSPTAKVFPRYERSLTNNQAGALLSICFHALVAAAPVVCDSKQLLDLSRLRSRGLTLAESDPFVKQPSSICLQYEDAFTDDMALRLARRLLAAIPTRRYFDDLIEHDLNLDEDHTDLDVLEILLAHLESSAGEAQTLIEFSRAERDMHERRVPILLLDWARAVMINDWDGKPEVSGNGPFGGALSLIAALYQRKNAFALLTDAAFRAEYFGDRLDTIEMPVSWLTFNSTRQRVHLLDFPYIFHPSMLVSYFRAVNFSRMSRSYEESSSLQSRIKAIIAPDSLVTDPHHKSVLQEMLRTPSAKFLILDIGRKTVLEDAFNQLWRREERELTRPLKVHLGEDTGEEGFDSGGVQQEFFRLAIAEALNPDYGAFTIDKRTRMTWFQPGSLQADWKFELIGLLISLAVFNGLTLPITFPKALYRKLLDEPVTELHHIADGWPDLANGLTTLQEWDEKDGAVEDIFARTYEFSVSMFGQPISREMGSSKASPWPQFASGRQLTGSQSTSNPVDAPLVTADNRNAYVSDYVRYLTDISVAPQYEAFARGFHTCLNPKSLSLLTPSLLQSLVEGTQEIDISELRRAARYVGWDASHRTVRDFWSIVKRYDDRMKRKLLEFVTASDRVPVGGMRNVQFVVQRNGEEEGEGGHLPTAYTCYGTLLLPEYRDKDVLRERLGMALENAQGFGFA